MRRFAQAWPHVDIELRESHSDNGARRPRRARRARPLVRAAAARQPVARDDARAPGRLRARHLRRASSFAAGGRTPTLREIAEQPLIGYRNCRATEIVVEQLRATGREPHFVFRTDENGVVQGLAGAGIGVAILPRLAVDPNDDIGADHRPQPADPAPPGRDRAATRTATTRRRRRRSSRPRSRSAPRRRSTWRRAVARHYSTVTVFARFRGWSTLRPRRRAMR